MIFWQLMPLVFKNLKIILIVSKYIIKYYDKMSLLMHGSQSYMPLIHFHLLQIPLEPHALNMFPLQENIFLSHLLPLLYILLIIEFRRILLVFLFCDSPLSHCHLKIIHRLTNITSLPYQICLSRNEVLLHVHHIPPKNECNLDSFSNAMYPTVVAMLIYLLLASNYFNPYPYITLCSLHASLMQNLCRPS